MEKTNIDQGTIASFTTKSFYGSKLKARARVDKRRCVKEDGSNGLQANFPTKFVPRILGPTVCWKVFYRQSDAFQFAQNVAEDVHVFSFESCSDPTKPSSGQRKYLASSLPVFWHYYSQLRPCQRQHYEIIPENAPCKLYFDLEFATDANPDRNGSEMVDTLIKYVCVWLHRVFGVVCDRKDILDLDASTSNKCSRHLIFQKPDLLFVNNVTQGDFVRYIFGVLLDWIRSTNADKIKGRLSSLSGQDIHSLDTFQHVSCDSKCTVDDRNAGKHSVNNSLNHRVDNCATKNECDDDYDLKRRDTGVTSDIFQQNVFNVAKKSDHNFDISVSSVDNYCQHDDSHSTLKQSSYHLQEEKSVNNKTEESATTSLPDVNDSIPVSPTQQLYHPISQNGAVNITHNVCNGNDIATISISSPHLHHKNLQCLVHQQKEQQCSFHQQKKHHHASSSQPQTCNTSAHSFNHCQYKTVDISQESKLKKPLIRNNLQTEHTENSKDILVNEFCKTKSPSVIKSMTCSENLIRGNKRHYDDSENEPKTSLPKSMKTVDAEKDNDDRSLHISPPMAGNSSNILTGPTNSLKREPRDEISSDAEQERKDREEMEFLQDNFSGQDLASLVVNKKDGTETLFCDLVVYTKNRNFRLYQSSKLNKNNHLKVAEGNQFSTRSTRPDINMASTSEDEGIFYASLISNVCVSAGVRLLRFDSVSKSGKVSFPGTKQCERRTSRDVGGFLFHEDKSTLEGWGCTSPYPEIDGYITSLLSGNDGRKGWIRHWNYWTSRQTLVYDIVGYRWCHNIQRHHRSNNIMYVVDVGNGVYYQKCHDPECQAVNYKSPEMELPRHVLPGFFLESDDFQEESIQDPCNAEKELKRHELKEEEEEEDDSDEEALLMAVEDVEMLESVGDLGL